MESEFETSDKAVRSAMSENLECIRAGEYVPGTLLASEPFKGRELQIPSDSVLEKALAISSRDEVQALQRTLARTRSILLRVLLHKMRPKTLSLSDYMRMKSHRAYTSPPILRRFGLAEFPVESSPIYRPFTTSVHEGSSYGNGSLVLNAKLIARQKKIIKRDIFLIDRLEQILHRHVYGSSPQQEEPPAEAKPMRGSKRGVRTGFDLENPHLKKIAALVARQKANGAS